MSTKFGFLSLGVILFSMNAFAFDDMYYSVSDAEKDVATKEEARKQKEAQRLVIKSRQQQNVSVVGDTIFIEDPSIASNEEFYMDTILVEDDSDFECTRRLNRFHDAGYPVYEVESPSTTVYAYVHDPFFDPFYSPYYPYWTYSYSSWYWHHSSCYYGAYWHPYCGHYYGHYYGHHYGHHHPYHPVAPAHRYTGASRDSHLAAGTSVWRVDSPRASAGSRTISRSSASSATRINGASSVGRASTGGSRTVTGTRSAQPNGGSSYSSGVRGSSSPATRSSSGYSSSTPAGRSSSGSSSYSSGSTRSSSSSSSYSSGSSSRSSSGSSYSSGSRSSSSSSSSGRSSSGYSGGGRSGGSGGGRR